MVRNKVNKGSVIYSNTIDNILVNIFTCDLFFRDLFIVLMKSQ